MRFHIVIEIGGGLKGDYQKFDYYWEGLEIIKKFNQSGENDFLLFRKSEVKKIFIEEFPYWQN